MNGSCLGGLSIGPPVLPKTAGIDNRFGVAKMTIADPRRLHFRRFSFKKTKPYVIMNKTPEIEISVQSVAQMIQLNSGEASKCLLIDCRQPNEYEHCRIEGSTLIPMNEIPDRLAELESHRDSAVVVHCHHGGRSLRVVEYLRANGFPQAQNMTGGIDVWSQEVDDSVPRY